MRRGKLGLNAAQSVRGVPFQSLSASSSSRFSAIPKPRGEASRERKRRSFLRQLKCTYSWVVRLWRRGRLSAARGDPQSCGRRVSLHALRLRRLLLLRLQQKSLRRLAIPAPLPLLGQGVPLTSAEKGPCCLWEKTPPAALVPLWCGPMAGFASCRFESLSSSPLDRGRVCSAVRESLARALVVGVVSGVCMQAPPLEAEATSSAGVLRLPPEVDASALCGGECSEGRLLGVCAGLERRDLLSLPLLLFCASSSALVALSPDEDPKGAADLSHGTDSENAAHLSLRVVASSERVGTLPRHGEARRRLGLRQNASRVRASRFLLRADSRQAGGGGGSESGRRRSPARHRRSPGVAFSPRRASSLPSFFG